MNKKIYFISDVHLGLHPVDKSLEREKKLVSWLDSIKHETAELYLCGDIFDFWHEWKRVVPKGFTRFLGKLSELADAGIKIHLFTGNHDIWIYDYLPNEIGLKLYRKPIIRELNGKTFFIGHGDGLGLYEKRYLLLKWCFTNKVLQWLFKRLHPNLSMAFGLGWSKNSRYSKGIVAEEFKGEEGEFQLMYAKEYIKKHKVDYFVFGHRHIPSDFKIADNTRVINLGDWIYSFTYAVWDGNDLKLSSVEPDNNKYIMRNH